MVTKKDGNSRTQEPADAMGRIRDILVGETDRSYRKRLDQLETRFQRDLKELRAELTQRLDSVEGFLRAELSSQGQLQAQSKQELERRQDTRLRETVEPMQAALDTLRKELLRTEQDFRARLLAQTKQLAEEQAARQAASSDALDRTASALDSSKADRTLLAALFADVAMRLNHDVDSEPEDDPLDERDEGNG